MAETNLSATNTTKAYKLPRWPNLCQQDPIIHRGGGTQAVIVDFCKGYIPIVDRKEHISDLGPFQTESSWFCEMKFFGKKKHMKNGENI